MGRAPFQDGFNDLMMAGHDIRQIAIAINRSAQGAVIQGQARLTGGFKLADGQIAGRTDGKPDDQCRNQRRGEGQTSAAEIT